MALNEMERRAVQEIEQELKQRLERETQALEDTQFNLTKLRIRAELFGKEDLGEKERECLETTYPRDVAKHEGMIARLQAHLDRLHAYAGA
jgi:hypothetical protein